MEKNVLLIGSGGREHALAWKLADNSNGYRVICAPGNGGTANMLYGENRNNINVNDFKALSELVTDYRADNAIGLTVVGPEDPLANGIVNYFTERKLTCFGPTKEAAQIEASKIYAKLLMKENNIPTANFLHFGKLGDYKPVLERIIDNSSVGIVVKDDGLAAGKGVTVCRFNFNNPFARARILNEARESVEAIIAKGHKVLVEEMLEGEEFSYIGVTDGKTFMPFLPSQDHKQIYDNDNGPNTGGMGAYAPAPVVTKEVDEEMRKIMQKTIDAMRRRGTPYKGALYAGCMMTKEGPKVLEFNCRFGDPETQAILPLFKGDFYKVLHACTTGELDNVAEEEDEWKVGAACCVVMASDGYPNKYEKGFKISGLENLATKTMGVNVFHAGTTIAGDNVITNGGRVLNVVGVGADIGLAISKAYKAVGEINFANKYYRKDIGRKAIMRCGK